MKKFTQILALELIAISHHDARTMWLSFALLFFLATALDSIIINFLEDGVENLPHRSIQNAWLGMLLFWSVLAR